MIYEYKNKESGESIEVDMPMAADHPRTVERDGKIYERVFSVARDSIHMPLGFTTREGRQISTPIRAKKGLHQRLYY